MNEVPANTAPTHVQPWALPHEKPVTPEHVLISGDGIVVKIARFFLRYLGAPKGRPDDHGVV